MATVNVLAFFGSVLVCVLVWYVMRRRARAAADRSLMAELGRLMGVAPRYGSPASLGRDVKPSRFAGRWFIVLCVVVVIVKVVWF